MKHRLSIMACVIGLSLTSLCGQTQFQNINLKSEINLTTITNIGNHIDIDSENGTITFK